MMDGIGSSSCKSKSKSKSISISLSKEAERSIAASSMFPGFRFSPTDEELILYYLSKKLNGFHKCVEVIPELDICKFEPWDLPCKAIIKSDEEWFFFSPRGKKYPNGSQSKRATEIGYWKATGKERAVKSGSNVIGTKRTLVFHIGRAPKGERTEWIMHEYCMSGKAQDALVVCRLRRKCEYHIHGGGPNNNNMAMAMASSGTYSGCGGMGLVTNANANANANTNTNTNTNTNKRDKQTGECSLKKSSSSHDSHSVEQTDSASQTTQSQSQSQSQSSWKNNRDDTLLLFQPESTSNNNNSNHVGNEDDLFAEILNDSIIQLDESLPPPSTYGGGGAQPNDRITTTVPIVPRIYDCEYEKQAQYPAQGTANRRIRLRKLQDEELEEGSGENMVSSNSNSNSKGLFKSPPGWMMRISDKNNYYYCSRLYVLVITTALLLILMMSYATTS